MKSSKKIKPPSKAKIKGYKLGGQLEGKDDQVNAVAGATGDLALLGGGALAASNQADDQGMLNVKKSTGAGALTGAGTGLKMGAGIGTALGGPVGTVIGGAIGATAGAGIGAVTGNRRAKKQNEQTQQEIDDLEALKAEQELAAKRGLAVNTALTQRNLENYKDGGKIEGKGTAKSDSIKAKVKENSFVVPAENGKVAEEIREKLLKAPKSKKANLKQSGGEEVKLSDGEHLFTPEETAELMAMGIDLNKLAPEARHELDEHMKCGGTVKGYKAGGSVADDGGIEDYDKYLSEKKKELDARKLELEKSIAQKNKTEAERKKLESEKIAHDAATERLNESIKDYEKEKAKYEKLNVILKTDKYLDEETKISRLDEQMTNLNKAKKRIDERASVFPSASKTKAVVKPEDFVTKKTEPTLKLSANEIKPTVSESVKIVEKPNGEVEVVEKPTEKKGISAPKITPTPSAKTSAPTVEPVEQLTAIQPKPQATEPIVAVNPNTGLAASTAPITTPPTITTDPPSASTDWGKVASTGLSALTQYGIPMAQTAIGLNALNKAGKRPVDVIDQDYLATIGTQRGIVDRANKQALFGLSAEENAMLEQKNQAETNAQRFAARNYSGGSAAAALNNERAATNEAYGRGLAAKTLNRNLMMDKQRYADSKQTELNNLNADKADRSRRLFTDTLTGWNQTQMAGAGLVNSGITNLTSADRYRQELEAARLRNEKYGR